MEEGIIILCYNILIISCAFYIVKFEKKYIIYVTVKVRYILEWKRIIIFPDRLKKEYVNMPFILGTLGIWRHKKLETKIKYVTIILVLERRYSILDKHRIHFL